jgi:hypothetical protein
MLGLLKPLHAHHAGDPGSIDRPFAAFDRAVIITPG